MDTSLRNTPALVARIEKLRDDLIKRFENLVGLAADVNPKIDRKDRTSTAVTQYQMRIETAALIRAAEDVQTLIRQLQEMWLFGQLNTLGQNQAQQRTDEDAEVVAQLLQQLMEREQQQPQQQQTNGSRNANDDAVMADGA